MFFFQGDVGCGKTVVSFLTCMEVINSGFQVLILLVIHISALITVYERVSSMKSSLPSHIG
jgi:ATP-dependent DNA helicase RecG